MGDDLQLDILAKVTSALKGMDSIEDKLKRVESQTKKLNKTNADLQNQAVAGFKKQQTAADEFSNSFSAGMGKSAQATRDFQGQASSAFLKLKGDFNVMKGIGIGVGGVATAAITAVVGIVAAASKQMDEFKAKAAELAETSGDKGTDAAVAISGLANVNQGQAAAFARDVGGVGTQDQINDFIKRLAVAKPDVDTKQFMSAVSAFAQTAIVPGVGEKLIEDLKATGGTSASSLKAFSQVDSARSIDPVGIAVLERKRSLESENIRLGGGDAPRAEQLTALEAANSALRRSVSRVTSDRDEREINERGPNSFGEAVQGRFGTTARAIGDATTAVVDTFRSGNIDTRAGRQKAESVIQEAHDSNRPIRVEVINQPRPVDGGL